MAAYLYNGPEYLETYVAAFKAGLAPVNTNYRYGPDEIVYLFDNADAEAVVFHASFTDLLDEGPRPAAQGAPLVRASPTTPATAPTGRRPTRPSSAGGADRVVGAVGALAATTCCCSTPAAPPACPRA